MRYIYIMIAPIAYWSHICLQLIPCLALAIMLVFAVMKLLQGVHKAKQLFNIISLVNSLPSLVECYRSLVSRSFSLLSTLISLVKPPIPYMGRTIPQVELVCSLVAWFCPQVELVVSLVSFVSYRFNTKVLPLANTLYSQVIPKTKHNER